MAVQRIHQTAKNGTCSFKKFPREVRGKAFLNWASIDLSSKLSVNIGGMLTIIKVFIIIFLLCQWEQETPCQFSKQISKLSKVSCPNWKGKKGRFWKGARSGTTLWDYPQEHLAVMKYEKVSLFVKFEIILLLLCFLWDLLTNKHYRTWTSMINLWIDSRTCQK